MSRLIILTEEEQYKFDRPPILSPEARTLCFMPSDEVQRKINQLKTPTNKVGFLLQYGYFKSCKRFFMSDRYREADIKFVLKVLAISKSDIHLDQYIYTTPVYHQEVILKLLKHQSF
jgi:hypothetical protein